MKIFQLFFMHELQTKLNYRLSHSCFKSFNFIFREKYVNHDKIYGIFHLHEWVEGDNKIKVSSIILWKSFFFVIKLHFENFESCGKQKLRTSINLIWFSPFIPTNLVIFLRRFFLLRFSIKFRNSWKDWKVHERKLCNNFTALN